jgi:hypothetical protein
MLFVPVRLSVLSVDNSSVVFSAFAMAAAI